MTKKNLTRAALETSVRTLITERGAATAKQLAEEVVKCVLDEVYDTLALGGSVNFPHCFTIKPRVYKARQMRTPQGVMTQIPARTKFIVGGRLAEQAKQGMPAT